MGREGTEGTVGRGMIDIEQSELTSAAHSSSPPSSTPTGAVVFVAVPASAVFSLLRSLMSLMLSSHLLPLPSAKAIVWVSFVMRVPSVVVFPPSPASTGSLGTIIPSPMLTHAATKETTAACTCKSARLPVMICRRGEGPMSCPRGEAPGGREGGRGVSPPSI